MIRGFDRLAVDRNLRKDIGLSSPERPFCNYASDKAAAALIRTRAKYTNVQQTLFALGGSGAYGELLSSLMSG